MSRVVNNHRRNSLLKKAADARHAQATTEAYVPYTPHKGAKRVTQQMPLFQQTAKHFLSVRDLTASEIRKLFQETARLKRSSRRKPPLTGKTLGLFFYKPSVRTRLSFEVGMAQLGGQSLYIGPVEMEGGKREDGKDLAKVASRYLDGIVARTFSHQQVEDLARWSSVPVINGLSDFTHPCQALSDLFTLQEKFGKLTGLSVGYVGDGNNVCQALIEASALTGIHLTVATPARYRPHNPTVRWAVPVARKSGGSIRLTTDPKAALRGASVVYTDVWTSMGQEKEGAKRRKQFRGFQVNRALFRLAKKNALFMHCLPAHRGHEVSDEVIDSPRSIVYDQAENRLHLQKGLLLRLLR